MNLACVVVLRIQIDQQLRHPSVVKQRKFNLVEVELMQDTVFEHVDIIPNILFRSMIALKFLKQLFINEMVLF